MQRRAWQWVKFALLIAVVAGAVAVLHACGVPVLQLRPSQVRAYVLSFGWWAPLAYGVVFAQPIVPVPASVMLMAGGLSFGMAGWVLALAAAALRACGQFFIARRLGRGAVETLLGGRLARFDQGIGKRAFETVFWIRVLPNVPFDFQNFGLGLSGVAFKPYLLATLAGLVPAVALWFYIGHHLAEPGSWLKIAVVIIGGFTLLEVTRRCRRPGPGVSS